MKPAYIICAYKRPDLLIRLVKSLESAPVAIHVDRKSDIFGTVQAQLSGLPNVTFLPRHLCHWGLFGHVEASLEGMEWFLNTSCDYAIRLTGQCYPLQPQSKIQNDLADLNGRSIIATKSFPVAAWTEYERGGYQRIERFYFKFGNRVQPRSIKLWTRTPPLRLHPHGGSSYWCLSQSCVDYVVTFVQAHSEVKRFFSTTFAPDETFFQTILANSPHKGELIDGQTHYIQWQHGKANPAILTASMLPAAIASGAWFARKFDDPAVLDLVDASRSRTDALLPTPTWRNEPDRAHVTANAKS